MIYASCAAAHLSRTPAVCWRKLKGSEMSEDWLDVFANTVEGQLVMPFYLICDVSFSMLRDMPALNDGIKRLRRAIITEPVIDDIAQVSIIAFSDVARVAVPMGPMSEYEIPELKAENAANYGNAFHKLAQTIETDTAKFIENGYQIYRPCAFFLTDGLPTDRDWHKTFIDTLTYDPRTGRGMKRYPVFVPFGFRDAREEVLRKLAYPPGRGRWYHSKGVDIEHVLEGILSVIMRSIVASGHSVGTTLPAIQEPGFGFSYGVSSYNPDSDPDWL